MKLIILLLSFIFGVISGGFLFDMKNNRLARFILGLLSMYGFLLVVVNFQQDSIKILNLFGYTYEYVSSYDQDLIDDIEQHGTVESQYIDDSSASDTLSDAELLNAIQNQGE